MIKNSSLSIIHYPFSIFGAGRLGGALAIALERRGRRIANLVSRQVETARRLAEKLNSVPLVFGIDNLSGFVPSEIVLICTPDPEIEKTAQRFSQIQFPAGTIFLHTSGSLSSEVLAVLREAGGRIGSLHPLVAVSDWDLGAAKFAGAYFCVEGDAEAVEIAEKIVADLQGSSFSIPTAQKSLYHAAAVMSAGHLVALFDAASATLADCGIEQSEARKILLPLIQSTVENLKHQTPAAALTGTFARADVETMRKHLAVLKESEALPIYIELGKRSIQLATEQGADADALQEMGLIIDN